ncbi:MAG: tetratricopeptide repeat protein [Deltaproteobacteria bacterium]|jgi:tetratricopeptide (TPR) repeat protein|nr:tetratricopeptide repeat protein [Deltaproteobacteria bacterium]
MENTEKAEKITGVFSTQEIQKVGTGTTTRKTIRKSFWYCIEQDNGQIEVQPLNTNFIPSGPKRMLEKDNFLAEFSPEPEFYLSTVYPRMREVTKTLARAERHRNNGELFSAEMEFGNAIKVDEENVRANFGLGLTYMARGDTAKAENILGRIVKLDAAFEPEHKHLFNEFGIQLRKNKMFKDSIAYYDRALELSSKDENLYYNAARAYLENKKPAEALEHLLKGIEINPAQPELAQFLLWMLNKNMVPDTKKVEVVEVLKKIKEAQGNVSAPAELVGPDEKAAAAEAGDNAATTGTAEKTEASAAGEKTATTANG